MRVTVMSFNVRCDKPSSPGADDGDDAWEHRRDSVAAVVLKYNAALVGLQVTDCDAVAAASLTRARLSSLQLAGHAWLSFQEGWAMAWIALYCKCNLDLAPRAHLGRP